MTSVDFKKIHFPSTSDCMYRRKKTEDIILTLDPSSVLDIGGVEYEKVCQTKDIKYTSINIDSPQSTGQGGYHRTSNTLVYNGRDLPFKKNMFDLVIVNFVLHHTANSTLFLLKQIHNISSKYVLIGEDLSELQYDIKWHKRNYDHQPGGVYRSDEEWRILFKLFKLKLKTQYIIHRDDDNDSNNIYRCLYLLEKE